MWWKDEDCDAELEQKTPQTTGRKGEQLSVLLSANCILFAGRCSLLSFGPAWKPMEIDDQETPKKVSCLS